MISGEDEQRALAALSAFIQDEFPHCDTPLPAAESQRFSRFRNRCRG
jgi:fructose-specific PTS system IIA-like component